jgi:FkbM family methyltransferase
MVNLLRYIKQYGILIFIAKIIKSLGIRLEIYIKKYRYSKIKTNFIINVDDDKFIMSFLDYEIGGTIQQRIEGVREPETTAIIKCLLRPGDKVLQIGGCYGYFAMLMANAVTSSGKVVSIEGLPNNFKILKNNINLNKCKNIDLYNYFIANKSNKIIFGKTDRHPYFGIEKFKKNLSHEFTTKETVSVDCINIPNFLDKIQFKPTHIFMDIEGFEVDAVEQLCDKYLEINSPTLVFEHHDYFYENGKGIEYMRNLLISKKYIVRKVYGNLIAFKN